MGMISLLIIRTLQSLHTNSNIHAVLRGKISRATEMLHFVYAFDADATEEFPSHDWSSSLTTNFGAGRNWTPCREQPDCIVEVGVIFVV